MSPSLGSFQAALALAAIGAYGAVAARSALRRLLSIQVLFVGVQLVLASLAEPLRAWRPPDSAGLHGLSLCVLVIAAVQALLGAALLAGMRSKASRSSAPAPPAEDGS